MDTNPSARDSGEQGLQNYVLQAMDPHGRKIVERVQALTAQQAIDALTARGFLDVRIETDDLIRMIPGGGGADTLNVSPRIVVWLQRASRGRRWLYLLWTLYRPVAPILGAMLAIFVFRRVMQRSFGWPDWLALVCLLVPLVVWAVKRNGVPRRFRQLQVQYVRARYDRVIVDAARIRKAGRGRFEPEFIDYVATEWHSRALAKLGRIDEAMGLLDELHARGNVRDDAIWCLRGIVNGAAKRFTEQCECYHKVTQIAPNNPAGWLGMAESLAIHLQQPGEARACFDHARALPLSPQLAEAMVYCEGVILFAEGRYGEARRCFEQYLPSIQRQAQSTPIAVMLEVMLRGQLAVSCARLGDHSAAQNHYNFARPYLELHAMEPILSRCRRESIAA